MNAHRAMGFGFAWALAGRAVYMLAQWSMLVMFARFGDPEMVGNFGLALSVSTPVFVLALVCMPILAASRFEHLPAGVFVSAAQVGVLLAVSVVVVLALLLFSGKGDQALFVFLSVALIKGLEGYSEVLYGVLRRKGKLAATGRSQALKGLSGGVLFAALLWATESPGIALLGFLAGGLLVLWRYDGPLCRNWFGGVNRIRSGALGWYRSIVRRAFPLSIMALATALAFNSPQYFIEAWRGTETLGFYVVINYFLIAMTTVGYVFAQSANAWLATSWREDEPRFWRQLIWSVAIVSLKAIAAWVFLFLFGEFLLLWVFGEKYAGFHGVLMLLFAAVLPLMLRDLLATALVIVGEVKLQAKSSMLGLAVVLLVCFLAVPEYGGYGAAAATLTGAWVAVFVLCGRLWKLHGKGKYEYAVRRA